MFDKLKGLLIQEDDTPVPVKETPKPAPVAQHPQGIVLAPGSKIMKEYCLVEEDLCWDPTIITQKRFTDFVAKVKEDFRYM